MSNQTGSFLQGLAGGIASGVAAKGGGGNLAAGLGLGAQTVQATAQNGADNTSGVKTAGGLGLGAIGQPAGATAQPQQGTQGDIQAGASGMWQNILSMIGGGGK